MVWVKQDSVIPEKVLARVRRHSVAPIHGGTRRPLARRRAQRRGANQQATGVAPPILSNSSLSRKCTVLSTPCGGSILASDAASSRHSFGLLEQQWRWAKPSNFAGRHPIAGLFRQTPSRTAHHRTRREVH